MALTKVSSKTLSDNAVTADKIATGAITITDIPDGEITAAKLHTTAVTDKLGYTPVAPGDSPSFAGLTVDTNTLYVDSTNNRVGIGTSSPGQLLSLYANDTTDTQLIIEQDSTGDAGIQFSLTAIKNWTVGVDNSDGDKFKIENGNAIGSSDDFVIDSSGNVGIGTSSPSEKLTISGNTSLSGNLIFTGTNNRITGDFSQVAVQESTANTNTVFRLLPNGTSTISSFRAFNNSDTTNANFAQIQCTSASARFVSGITGTATLAPILFILGSNEQMRIDSSGNVGIGTSSPSSKLHILTSAAGGTAPNTPVVTIQHNDINAIGTGGTDGGKINFINLQRDNTAWTANKIWGRIDFYGSQPTSGTAQLGASILAAGAGGGGLTLPSYLSFYTSDGSNNGNNVERMRIDSSGNVGIGITNPGQKLNVSDGTTTLLMHPQGGIGYAGTYSDHPYVFTTGNGERMRIDTGGNVLINTTVARASTVTPKFIISAGDSSATTIKTMPCGLAIINAFNGDSTGYGASIKMHLSGNNEVGKYAAISVYASRTFGNGTGLRFWTNPTGENGTDNTVQRMQIDHSGSIGAGGSSTNIYNASDMRLKKDVQPISSAINTINALNPVSFKWIDGFASDEHDKILYGFVAQEVQEVDTNLIENFGNSSVFLEQQNSEDLIEVDNPLRVNEKFIIPLLTKAIQELKIENDTLKSQLSDLETRMQALENQ